MGRAGGFIILQDGRAYAAANWAYDRTLPQIADALPASPEAADLAEWLRQQSCEKLGPGMGSVDLHRKIRN